MAFDDVGDEEPLPRLRWATKKNRGIRKRVYERDNFTCRMCSWRPECVPLDYDGKETIVDWVSPSMAYLTIDHIVPLSHGGDHSESNLQTLCNSCNSSKCDLMPSKGA